MVAGQVVAAWILGVWTGGGLMWLYRRRQLRVPPRPEPRRNGCNYAGPPLEEWQRDGHS